MSKIHEILSRIRPTSNAVALNKAAGLPPNTIGKHYSFLDGKEQYGFLFPSKHAFRLVWALCLANGGSIQTGIYTIVADADDPATLIIEWPDGPDEENETDGVFKYNRTLNKAIYTPAEFSAWCDGREIV